MFTPEEQEERRKCIGASEAAGVLGLSRWQTPLSIWASKTGKVKPSTEEQFCQWYGTEVEEVVAKRFTLETGKKVHKVNEPFVHKKHKFLRCNIDRKVEGENAILQCKTVTPYKSSEWTDSEVPDEYVIQELHELACSGYDRAYIAVAIGNLEFKIKIVDRDDKLIQDIVDKEVAFWNTFVVPDVMPIAIKADDKDTLYSLYPQEVTGDEIELDDEANKKVESLQAMKQDRKVIESNIAREENELKAMLRDKEAGKSSLWVVSWKAQVAQRVDSDRLKSELPALYEKYCKESKSRVLRIKANKEKK